MLIRIGLLFLLAACSSSQTSIKPMEFELRSTVNGEIPGKLAHLENPVTVDTIDSNGLRLVITKG